MLVFTVVVLGKMILSYIHIIYGKCLFGGILGHDSW